MPCQSSLISLLPQASKVSFWFNAKLSKCVRHAKEKEKKKKKKVIRPWVESWNREPFSHFGVSFRESKTQKRESFSLRGAVRKDREKHSESVREWKRKMKHFFFAQVTHKEDILVESLWSFWVLQPWRVRVFRGRFCYWLCGEIVFTPWDLFIVYPIYRELKFSINLIVVISIS